MAKEKRQGGPPIPANFEAALSPEQLITLRQIENFGWKVEFIRRPLFEESVVVVSNPDGRKIGILENDGRLNMHPDIKLRD
jgi:hypothetical protein